MNVQALIDTARTLAAGDTVSGFEALNKGKKS